jgi:hypothetical protein
MPEDSNGFVPISCFEQWILLVSTAGVRRKETGIYAWCFRFVRENKQSLNSIL